VKRSLPGDASGADIMRAIGSRWKSLSKEEKKPFVNQRNAWLFSQGRTPKNLGGRQPRPACWLGLLAARCLQLIALSRAGKSASCGSVYQDKA
jgi:hypothetical protein